MVKRKKPSRQCVGCNEMKLKTELLRIIKTPDGEILFDSTGKQNGRGAYICCSSSCLVKAKKTKALDKSLRMAIPSQVYDALEKELKQLERK
ncbi:MAG: YlxR family protein [Lachnospiraceae bacterium]|nr:YlxR family protein [Lachnospiraceae bacterium]